MKKGNNVKASGHAVSGQSRKGSLIFMRWAVVLLIALLPSVAGAESLMQGDGDDDFEALARAVQKYSDVGSFSNGLAEVENGGRWGFINIRGEEVIPCKYDEASVFSEGFAAVRLDDKCGLINTRGEEVVRCKYDVACDFSEGLARVQIGDKWGYVNKDGQDTFGNK